MAKSFQRVKYKQIKNYEKANNIKSIRDHAIDTLKQHLTSLLKLIFRNMFGRSQVLTSPGNGCLLFVGEICFCLAGVTLFLVLIVI